MSLDINELVRLVKRAAVEAVQAGAPMSGGYGYVTSTSPLEITVDQKKILTGAQLILTDAVRDYTVEMTTMPEYRGNQRRSRGCRFCAPQAPLPGPEKVESPQRPPDGGKGHPPAV